MLEHHPDAVAAPEGPAPRRAGWALQDPLLTDYYDREWGTPLFSETEVYERLCLEGFQAGLSWITVLRKRDALREAFEGFDPDRVATFTAADVERLMGDERIIRNRSKIASTISNADATLRLRETGTDLAGLVWSYMPERTPTPETEAEVPTRSPESAALARDLKRRGFRFVGPTIVYALMSAIGIVDAHPVDSHRRGCSGLWNADGTRSDRAEELLGDLAPVPADCRGLGNR